MFKSFKVMLHPNNKQRTKLFQCFGVSRFAYNWALNRQQENYKNGGKFISAFDLQKEFGQLKKLPEYSWLNSYSSVIPEMAIMDACESYKNFFRGNCNFPKFKNKKKSKPSFYVHPARIEFTDTYVKLMKLSNSKKKNKRKLNWVRLAETEKLKLEYPNAVINPLGDWTGGYCVDSGCTNRKLGSDMADSVTGGGINGKDCSKADVSVNIYAFLKAQETGKVVELSCAIGDEYIDGKPYSEIVAIAKKFIDDLGGFEKFSEWGLF